MAVFLVFFHPRPTSRSPPHLHRPGASSDSLDPPDDDPAFPAVDIVRFETIRAGSWHNHYPGETRITLDLTGFVSFYDTALAPSLVAGRQGVERCDHRLAGISSADLEAVKSRLGEALTRGPNGGSGVDWQMLYRVVLERCVQRRELLDYLLNTTMPHNVNERARQIQTQLRGMLAPYVLYTSRPTPRGISTSVDYTSNDLWALLVWQARTSRHTAHIHTSAALQSRLTPPPARAGRNQPRDLPRCGAHTAANPLAVVGAWRARIDEVARLGCVGQMPPSLRG
ncbi:hypothetical protein B0H14DRAFT_3443035 [Mycena olivaceomarginata]|nr:hypothetical protein B0H14DRAFT_3443035 [Mycena olivaceomarginata]